MIESTPPFTGEYPTRDEALQALTTMGFGDAAETEVFVPFDQSTSPLADAITRCRSAQLSSEWPHGFRAAVNMILKAQK